jgi:spore germination cell wall hydrolase CwlJ-like protein
LILFACVGFGWITALAVQDYVDTKEVECLAKNLYFEARNESTAGQIAVLQTTINRVGSPFFPDTVCGVVYEGIHKNGIPVRDACQFSWYCDGMHDSPVNSDAYDRSVELSSWILITNKWLPDLTDGATYYHASWMENYPIWSRTKIKTLQIDQHIFYK